MDVFPVIRMGTLALFGLFGGLTVVVLAASAISKALDHVTSSEPDYYATDGTDSPGCAVIFILLLVAAGYIAVRVLGAG
jgi:hypothetical protein